MRPPTKAVTVWVSDRPNRFLALEWHDPITGARRTRSAKTNDRDEAARLAAELQANLNAGIERSGDSVSWERFREAFLAEYAAGLRPRSVEKYRTVFDRFEAICGPTRLDRIDERTLTAFVVGMRKLGREPWTIRNYLGGLRAAFRWAVDQGWMSPVRIPTVKVPRLKPKRVNAADVAKLLAVAVDPHDRAMILLGWLAGLRISEAWELRWQETDRWPWVDFAHREIVFPARFVKADADQTVPLHPQLAECLSALPRDSETVMRHVDRRGTKTAGVTGTANAAGQRIIALANAAGVSLRHHDLRRGFCSAIAARHPPAVLMALARHSSIQTTMQFYANVDASMKAAVEALELP